MLFKRNFIALKLGGTEVKTWFNARTVHLSKKYTICHVLTYAKSSMAVMLIPSKQQLGNSNVLYYNMNNPVKLQLCKALSP